MKVCPFLLFSPRKDISPEVGMNKEVMQSCSVLCRGLRLPGQKGSSGPLGCELSLWSTLSGMLCSSHRLLPSFHPTTAPAQWPRYLCVFSFITFLYIIIRMFADGYVWSLGEHQEYWISTLIGRTRQQPQVNRSTGILWLSVDTANRT